MERTRRNSDSNFSLFAYGKSGSDKELKTKNGGETFYVKSGFSLTGIKAALGDAAAQQTIANRKLDALTKLKEKVRKIFGGDIEAADMLFHSIVGYGTALSRDQIYRLSLAVNQKLGDLEFKQILDSSEFKSSADSSEKPAAILNTYIAHNPCHHFTNRHRNISAAYCTTEDQLRALDRDYANEDEPAAREEQSEHSCLWRIAHDDPRSPTEQMRDTFVSITQGKLNKGDAIAMFNAIALRSFPSQVSMIGQLNDYLDELGIVAAKLSPDD